MSLIRPVGTPFTFIPTDSRSNTVTACNAGSGYLKTGATGGFLYVPQMSGAPNSTGATGYTGTVAMCFDTQNNMPWYLNPNNTFGGSTGPSQLNWVAGNGQVLIGKTILTSATGSVSFTGISQAFNHLKVIVQARADDAAGVGYYLRFNGDLGANYDFEYCQGFNNTTTGSQNRAQTSILVGVLTASNATANCACSSTIDVPLYNRTVFFKTVNCLSGSVSVVVNDFSQAIFGQWRSTSAVTSVTLFDGSTGNFIVGSGFFLYGVW